MMKKLLAAAAFAICGTAFAAGPFDGVYQLTGAPAFYSVHQNGNILLIVSLSSVPASGITFGLTGGYSVRPPTVEAWSIAAGVISGNTARVTGTGPYGSCTTTSDAVFDDAGNVAVTFVATAQTALANQQAINCSAVLQAALAVVGPTLTLRKIF
jgi:hypothetical protein